LPNKGQRRQPRLDQIPKRPQNCPFVARHKVAPDKELDQATRLPQLTQAQVKQIALGADDYRPCFRRRGLVGRR